MSIVGYLDARAVKMRLESQTRDDVLRELVHLIPELQGRAAEQLSLWQSLADREKLHTTAVGDGLAFPHARNAMGNILKSPVVVVGKHDKGVPWDAADAKPVQWFFMLAAPSLTEHLHLLGKMSRILRNAGVRSDLAKALNAQQVIDVLKAGEAKVV